MQIYAGPRAEKKGFSDERLGATEGKDRRGEEEVIDRQEEGGKAGGVRRAGRWGGGLESREGVQVGDQESESRTGEL